MKKLLILIALINIQLLAGVATITAMKGKATIQREDKTLTASLGTTLEEKDNILTQDNTKLQIIFKDETIISIGKNSSFSINEYLFEDTQAPIAKFSMLKGAMRTITGHIGDIAPEKFTVATKTATIGIRGTNFSVVVGEDGSYNAFCTYGAISVTLSGQTHIVPQGFFLSVGPTGTVKVEEFSSQDLKEMKKENFEVTGDKVTSSEVTAPGGSPDTSNNQQLDVTKTDTSNIIITEVTEVSTDGAQASIAQNGLGETSSDLATLLAGYTNTVTYSGTSTVTQDGGGDFSGSGTAALTINFGADTISLNINDLETYNLNPNFTATGFTVENIDGEQTGIAQKAAGTFLGSTGNQVQGTFNGEFGGFSTQTKGVFDVSTAQVIQ